MLRYYCRHAIDLSITVCFCDAVVSCCTLILKYDYRAHLNRARRLPAKPMIDTSLPCTINRTVCTLLTIIHPIIDEATVHIGTLYNPPTYVSIARVLAGFKQRESVNMIFVSSLALWLLYSKGQGEGTDCSFPGNQF